MHIFDSYKLINKYKWEAVRQVRLNYGNFKIAIYDASGYYVIYSCGCMFSYSLWFIYCWYHTKFKHYIYQTLDFFVCFEVEEVNVKISCKKKSFVDCSTI